MLQLFELVSSSNSSNILLNNKIAHARLSDDALQKSCCGVDSKIGDFNESGWYQLTGRKHHFPPACCPPNKNGVLMEFCPTIARYGDVSDNFCDLIL